jgi:hypothetical protein
MASYRNPEGFRNGNPTLYGVEIHAADYAIVKRLHGALASQMPTSTTWDDDALAVGYALNVLADWRAMVDRMATRRGIRVVR